VCSEKAERTSRPEGGELRRDGVASLPSLTFVFIIEGAPPLFSNLAVLAGIGLWVISQEELKE
jgi:hypothetical protein